MPSAPVGPAGQCRWSVPFGVANNSTLDVYQLLLAGNTKAVKGLLYNGAATLQAQCADLFSSLDQAGNIG